MMKEEGALTSSQIQATRLNELEHRRLRQNLDLLQEDFKVMLDRLQREAHDLKDHYTNVVRVVKPNPKYDSWKQDHADEIVQGRISTSSSLFSSETLILGYSFSIESMRIKSNFGRKQHKRAVLSNDILEESTRPLLVLLLDNHRKKSVEPLIDFSADFLRPNTSPTKRNFPDIRRKNALSTMFQGSKQPEPHVIPPKSSSAQRVRHRPSPPSTRENHSNVDALYRIALQNQTAFKSTDQPHIEKRKLLDRDFAKRHQAMRATLRSAACVK